MGIFDWVSRKELDEPAVENFPSRNVKVYNMSETVSSEDIINSLRNGDIALIKILKDVESENDVVGLLNNLKRVCGEIGGDIGRFSESWYIATPTNVRIQRKPR